LPLVTAAGAVEPEYVTPAAPPPPLSPQAADIPTIVATIAHRIPVPTRRKTWPMFPSP
jgi:hypothetical protein